MLQQSTWLDPVHYHDHCHRDDGRKSQLRGQLRRPVSCLRQRPRSHLGSLAFAAVFSCRLCREDFYDANCVIVSSLPRFHLGILILIAPASPSPVASSILSSALWLTVTFGVRSRPWSDYDVASYSARRPRLSRRPWRPATRAGRPGSGSCPTVRAAPPRRMSGSCSGTVGTSFRERRTTTEFRRRQQRGRHLQLTNVELHESQKQFPQKSNSTISLSFRPFHLVKI